MQKSKTMCAPFIFVLRKVSKKRKIIKSTLFMKERFVKFVRKLGATIMSSMTKNICYFILWTRYSLYMEIYFVIEDSQK